MQEADGAGQKAAEAQAQADLLPAAQPPNLPQIIALPNALHNCILLYNGKDFLGISLLKDLRFWGEAEYSSLREIILENVGYRFVFLAGHLGIIPKKINLPDTIFCETGIIADLDTPADILETIVRESGSKGFNSCILDIYRDRYSPVQDLLSEEIYAGELGRQEIIDIIRKYPAYLGFSDVSLEDISLLPGVLLSKPIYMFKTIQFQEVGRL